jgi:large subunit ribosomal protein L11
MPISLFPNIPEPKPILKAAFGKEILYNNCSMAKKVKTLIKLNLKAGEATPAPPVGPALGQHGLNIMEFVKAYNARTSDKKGEVIPAVITVFEDNTFSFVTKLAPVSAMIKKALRLDKASAKPGREEAGSLSKTQVEQIAKDKLDDLNTTDLEQAKRIVEGTARSMGITIK